MAATEISARANAALDDLYRRHVGDVYRYTYAVLGNHADAEDVTQTTFVNALRALERGETPDDPSRWLLVIAHNLVRQRWRQAASRPPLVELERDVPDATDGDEDAPDLDELVRALQRIPPAQREALVMRELEGRPYREIADVLGLTTSALETLLFRARRSLAEEIENVVTCQNAELAISKRLDGRLSRKDRKRLEEHLAECEDCARLAKTATRQRKAFKGLALLPLPIGLALFKGAPSAAAATSLPTIGVGTTGAGATGTGTGAAGVGAAGATGAGAAATGGAAVGGSLVGGIALKVAAVAVVASVATGVGYKGVQAVRDTPSKPAPAHVRPASNGATGKSSARHVAPAPAHGEHGKALGHAKQNGQARGKSAGARERGKGHSSVTPPGLARRSGGAEHPGAAKTKTAKAKAIAKGRSNPKPAKTPKTEKPKRKIAPGAGAPKGSPKSSPPNGSPKTTAPKNDGKTTAPPAPVVPTSDPAPDDGTTPPSDDTTTTDDPSTVTGDDPTDQPTTAPPPASEPVTTPPPTSDPVTTPPTEPPTGNPGAGTPGPSPGQGVPGEDQGLKLGHKKGKHDGRHPEDS